MKHLTKKEFKALAEAHATTRPVAVTKVKLGGKLMHQLVATSNIEKNSTIAVYPVQIFDDDKVQNYEYAIEIHKNNGHDIPELTGIPTLTAVSTYKGRHPPIGMFVNEPVDGERENAKMKFPRVDVHNKEKLIGSVALATIVATRTIDKGATIAWCYGCNYVRDYSTPCSKHC
jgi:hypothetical protein